MEPLLVFFAIATLVGCLIRAVVEVRLRRVVARQPDIAEGDLCELRQANRISSLAVLASLAGLAVAVLVFVVL
jgi:hypothetical protein